MKARHGNGQVKDANEIVEGDPLKPGPWFCATPGCPVQFKYHRVASYAVDEPGRVLRSATFAHGDDRDHLQNCALNHRAQLQRLLAAHAGVVTVEGDKLLLHWGESVRKAEASGSRPPTAGGRSREKYAAVLKAATDIAGVVDKSDDDESVLAQYWVVHRGIRYTWAQFCFGPTAANLARLGPSLSEAFNDRPTHRPRLVRAQVADVAAEVTNNPKRLKLRLRAIDKLDDGSYVRGWLFVDAGTAQGEAVRQLRAGQQIFILGDDWFLFGGRPALNIVTSAQLARFTPTHP